MKNKNDIFMSADLSRHWNDFEVLRAKFVAHVAEKDSMARCDFWALNPSSRWLTVVVPSSWLVGKRYVGTAYTLNVQNPKSPSLRLYVFVQHPIKEEFRDAFKKDVVSSVREAKIQLPDCKIFPHAGGRLGSYLVETKHVEMSEDGLLTLQSIYDGQDKFRCLVSDKIRAGIEQGYYKKTLSTQSLEDKLST